jgi:hypothetical protein
MSLSCIKSSLESYFMPCLFEDYVSISNFCDLLSYLTTQVIILEYVVPRVLEYPCVKFDRVSMSKHD